MGSSDHANRFHRFTSRGAVAAWESGIFRRWPYRYTMIDTVSTILSSHRPKGPLHVVEIAAGPGLMALNLLREIPHLTYTGLDYSVPLSDFARRRLSQFGPRAEVWHEDANEDAWTRRLPAPVQAFVSLQAMHDLGNQDNVVRIYAKAFELLDNDGLFVNADFVTAPGKPNANDPGRLPVARHFEVLRDLGYAWTDCIARQGDMACLVAGKR